MLVYQLVEPATTWALVCEKGATPARSRMLDRMEVTSSSVSVVRDPLPRRTPPLVMLPGVMMMRFAPRLSICFSTAACAPEPMAMEAITAPTPMMMPSMVRRERLTLRRSAFHEVRMSTRRFMTRSPRSCGHPR